jgi:apolipoprotein N-acyltransferase
MPTGEYQQAGVFICIESAYPSIARTMALGGADVLINISNDGYLGPTAVMRQHLANAVFRAAENDRPVLRVTNSGITAFIERDGQIRDETKGFETAVRVWTLEDGAKSQTFYTKYGDIMVMLSSALTGLLVLASLLIKRRGIKA